MIDIRSEYIGVTFKIPVPVDKPDGNGIMFNIDAIKKACENFTSRPLEYVDKDGASTVIGTCDSIKFLEDENVVWVDGYVWHGGTCESVDLLDKIVNNMTITSFGICSE